MPSVRAAEQNDSENYAVAGFVDEQAIARMMEMPCTRRRLPQPIDLALSAGDDDFAGWRRTPASPFIAITNVTTTAPGPVKRAKPPEIDEPGIGQPVGSGHRWWLAGVAGMTATFLFSMLLLSISNRNSVGPPIIVPEPIKNTTQTAEPPADSGLEITLHHPAGGI